jgi:hypothetical protein
MSFQEAIVPSSHNFLHYSLTHGFSFCWNFSVTVPVLVPVSVPVHVLIHVLVPVPRDIRRWNEEASCQARGRLKMQVARPMED